MNRIATAARSLARLFVLLLLCVALCAAFAFSSAALGARGLDAFGEPAAASCVAEAALSGESESLRQSLLSLDAFRDAASDYSRALAAWRFENGAEWQGLDDETCETLARELLVRSLSKEDTPAAGIVGRADAAAIEDLIAPVQAALKNVFPPFSSIMQGEFAQRVDGFGTVVSGRAALYAFGACALLVALHFVFYRDGRERLLIFAVALLAATIGCVILRAVGKLPLLTSAASARMGWFLLLFGGVSFLGTIAFVHIAVPFVKDFAKEKFAKEQEEGDAEAENAAQPSGEENETEAVLEADEAAPAQIEEAVEEAPETEAAEIEEAAPAQIEEAVKEAVKEAEELETAAESDVDEIEAAKEAEPAPATEADDAETAEEIEEIKGSEEAPESETETASQTTRTYSAAPGSAALAADRDFDDGSFFEEK